MAPSVRARLTQEEFDALVKENMEEFGMEREEAVEDAIKTFTMQGVGLTGMLVTQDLPWNLRLVLPKLVVFLNAGIVTTVGDDGQLHEHAAKQAVQKLRDALDEFRKKTKNDKVSVNPSLVESLSGLRSLLSTTGRDGQVAGQATADSGKETAEAALVAAQNGGMAVVMDVLAIAVPVTVNTQEEQGGVEERRPEGQSDSKVAVDREAETAVPIEAAAACSALHALLPLLQLGR